MLQDWPCRESQSRKGASPSLSERERERERERELGRKATIRDSERV
jgi:hypothetical protein